MKPAGTALNPSARGHKAIHALLIEQVKILGTDLCSDLVYRKWAQRQGMYVCRKVIGVEQQDHGTALQESLRIKNENSFVDHQRASSDWRAKVDSSVAAAAPRAHGHNVVFMLHKLQRHVLINIRWLILYVIVSSPASIRTRQHTADKMQRAKGKRPKAEGACLLDGRRSWPEQWAKNPNAWPKAALKLAHAQPPPLMTDAGPFAEAVITPLILQRPAYTTSS